ALARIAATALDQARRTNAALDRADRLASLLDSASAFAGELDLDALFAAIHDQVRRHMDAPVFAVALQQGDSGQLRTEYMVDSGVRLNVDAVPPATSVVTEVFVNGRPLVLASSGERSVPDASPTDRRVESALFVPMRVHERTIGVMVAQSHRPDAYEEEQVQLLLEVAGQAAVAIQNAGVVRDERRRMNELAVLHRLAALTNSEQSFDRIMTAIVNEAAAIFRADAVSIALENEHGDFRLAATYGMSDAYQRNRIISGPVLRSLYGVPPTEHYLGPEQLAGISPDIVASEGVTNWFLVPLLHQNRLVGGLALGGRERSIRLSPSETRLAQLFAENAAAAMLRAQSAHALTERIEDYDLLTRVGHGLVSRLDVDYDAILRLLHEQLGYTHLA
ncbi:MAG TPA: GAF domain-containing protein, partial [Caldimonas sp.]|nr:GAF domain-containing protein [Caldimonas sp.]